MRSAEWTKAGSLARMRLPHTHPSQGAGHAIVSPARLVGHHLRRHRPLAGQTLCPPRSPVALWPPLRLRPAHLHLLVPRRRHPRGLPQCLHHHLRPRASYPARAISVLSAVKPLLNPSRLRLAIDDTPTPRYGPEVEGCGIHHNPRPGLAGERHVYGHVWVTLTVLANHPDWGCIALPLQAQLYLRKNDLAELPHQRQRPFRTKLEMAVEQMRGAKTWAGHAFKEFWLISDGGYAKRPVMRGNRGGPLQAPQRGGNPRPGGAAAGDGHLRALFARQDSAIQPS